MQQLSQGEPVVTRTEQVEEMKLVGIQGVESYETRPLLLMQLRERADEIPHRLGADVYVLDEHEGTFVGVRVSAFGELPPGMVPFTIPAGEYAVFSFAPAESLAIREQLQSPELAEACRLEEEGPQYEIIHAADRLGLPQELCVKMRALAVKVIALPELRLVGIPVEAGPRAPDYQEVIGQAIRALAQRADEIQGQVHASPLPAVLVSVPGGGTEEEGCWMCTEVEAFGTVPEGMEALTIPVQSYAYAEHQGPAGSVLQSWEQLNRWIGEHGYERQQRAWQLEFYETWDGQTGLTVARLYAAVTV